MRLKISYLIIAFPFIRCRQATQSQSFWAWPWKFHFEIWNFIFYFIMGSKIVRSCRARWRAYNIQNARQYWSRVFRTLNVIKNSLIFVCIRVIQYKDRNMSSNQSYLNQDSTLKSRPFTINVVNIKPVRWKLVSLFFEQFLTLTVMTNLTFPLLHLSFKFLNLGDDFNGIEYFIC